MECENYLQNAPSVIVVGKMVFFSAVAEVKKDGVLTNDGKVKFPCRLKDGAYSCNAYCTSPTAWKDKVKQGAKLFLQGTVMYINSAYDSLTLNATIQPADASLVGGDPLLIIKKYK